MSLLERLSGALRELSEDGCPNIRDRYTQRRCGRRRYWGKYCFACAEIKGKPLDLVMQHASEYGLSLRGAFLEEARLAGGELRWVSFQFANLKGADLRGADLRGADLSEANLTGAEFCGADLTHARLRELKELVSASFVGAVLEEAVFCPVKDALVKGLSFERADLTRARLADADLRGANFRSARLVGADLRRAMLDGADFSSADLTDADLSGASLVGANFEGACLNGVRLSGGKGPSDLQSKPASPEHPKLVLGACMREFAMVEVGSDRTRLRVLARKALQMRREDALDLILPILEKKDAAERFAEEAISALRALGRDPSTRPFLVGLLSRGAEKMRLEAASILSEPPLDDDTVELFRAILTSSEHDSSFRRGVFRTLAPAIEDRDPGSLKLARSLLDSGETFDGELIAALAQSGATDDDYLARITEIAFDESKPEQVRLAAARDLAERFFSTRLAERFAEIFERKAGSKEFRRNLFWFVARRVAGGEPAAMMLAKEVLASDPELESDVRWALAEGGDVSQAAYFTEVVRRGAEAGWSDGSGAGGGLPSYDDLVRAAQVLGRIGTSEAVKYLAALIRRDKAGAAPAGAPFSLTEAARDAILELRSSGVHTAGEKTEVIEPPAQEVREPAQEGATPGGTERVSLPAESSGLQAPEAAPSEGKEAVPVEQAQASLAVGATGVEKAGPVEQLPAEVASQVASAPEVASTAEAPPSPPEGGTSIAVGEGEPASRAQASGEQAMPAIPAVEAGSFGTEATQQVLAEQTGAVGQSEQEVPVAPVHVEAASPAEVAEHPTPAAVPPTQEDRVISEVKAPAPEISTAEVPKEELAIGNGLPSKEEAPAPVEPPPIPVGAPAGEAAATAKPRRRGRPKAKSPKQPKSQAKSRKKRSAGRRPSSKKKE